MRGSLGIPGRTKDISMHLFPPGVIDQHLTDLKRRYICPELLASLPWWFVFAPIITFPVPPRLYHSFRHSLTHSLTTSKSSSILVYFAKSFRRVFIMIRATTPQRKATSINELNTEILGRTTHQGSACVILLLGRHRDYPITVRNTCLHYVLTNVQGSRKNLFQGIYYIDRPLLSYSHSILPSGWIFKIIMP